MVSKEITITNESGLHARPAALFIKEATTYQSDITIIRNGREVNGKSMLSLLSLGAAKGQVIELQITGVDEQEALHRLIALFENNFGE